jgi:predicted permease
MDRLWQDLRFSARVLWKDRSYTLTIVATLALCLAANVAIFAIVDNVLLKPLPFAEPDRLVRLYNRYPGAGIVESGNGVPDYFDRVRDMSALEALANYRQAGVTISGRGTEAERVQALLATPSFLRVLRAEAYRGRVFTDADGELGQHLKLLLTYGAWQRLFGGRDDAIGQQVRVNGEPHDVVGVLGPGFRFINPEIQMIRPAAFSAEEKDARHNNNWQQIGRLKPGATVELAQSQVDAINRANDDRFPKWREILKNAQFGTVVVSFQDSLVQNTRRTLTLLWGGVLFVLIIGCVNVANLVLVRSSSRLRELATRHALGASVPRLARQYLTETTLLSLLGGLAGLGLGWWALRAAPYLGLDQLPRGAEIAMDGRVVGFTLALVGLVGAAMAALPVVALRRANLAQVVREEGRSGTAGRGSRLVRRVLVTSQVAFALVLLVGAGVMLASFQRILAIDAGFRPDHVLTGTISLPPSTYATPESMRTTAGRFLERVRALPGVSDAGISNWLPLSGSSNDSVILAEGYQMSPGESLISPNNMAVSEGFFEAMGATLVSGRLFTAADTAGQPRVLVIDERLARRFWPKGDAVGRRMYQPGSAENLLAKPSEDQMLTVVGVVRNMRLVGIIDSPAAVGVGTYYFPLGQSPTRALNLTIRTTQDPESVVGSVRREVAAIDPELPFYGVRTLQDRVDAALVDRRTPTLLASGFAVVALLLAAIGIYGVLAYQVAQRRREIGIRMALGAAAPRIFGLVLGEGALIVGVGSMFGLLGAFFLRRAIESQLYQVGAMDPRVLVMVGLVLIVVALVACVLPARRASKTDPAIALTE